MPTGTSAPDAAWRQRLRRLPGRSPTLRWSREIVAARLWVDERQLVQETVRGYRQEIQRFAFADLQAVQVRRTSRGLVYNVLLAVPLVLLLLSVAGAWDGRFSFSEHRARLISCGLLAVLLAVNVARGATCHTVLLTALGPQRLCSLSRMRAARRALDAINAGVEAAQGTLRPDEAARLVDDQARVLQRPVPTSAAPLPGYHY